MRLQRALTLGGSAVAVVLMAGTLAADSNIASTHKYAWMENPGWSNWADAVGRTLGVEVYQTGATQYLRGWIWAENFGWISVGAGGAPYANTTGLNHGVNIDPSTGLMTGFAWSENAGWINFGPYPPAMVIFQPRWDHLAFRARGWAWSENKGWLNLDDGVRFICAIPGDVTHDGVVNIFDYNLVTSKFGSTGLPRFTSGDADGDGDVDIFDFNAVTSTYGRRC